MEIEITDPSLVPDELCDVTITMSARLWYRFLARVGEHLADDRNAPEILAQMKTSPKIANMSRIRAALNEKCPVCHGREMCCADAAARRVPCTFGISRRYTDVGVLFI